MPTKTDYTELDAAILAHLERGPDDFNALSWAVRHISDPLAKIDPRGRATGWRVVDRRLQALRKRGLIKHGSGSWGLVQKEGA